MHRRIGHEKDRVDAAPNRAHAILLMRGLHSVDHNHWGSGDFDKYITGGWAVQTSAGAHSALE